MTDEIFIFVELYIEIMTLEEILLHRRAVRRYDPDKPIDVNAVKECIRLATLSPTSSNMQLWEAYHIINPIKLQELSIACLGQGSARTCKQMVIFVTRKDKWKSHANAVLAANIEEIKNNSPKDKQIHHIELQNKYYKKLIPLTYKRCWGLLGLFRKVLTTFIGFKRPIPRNVTEADINTVVHKSCALAIQTFMLAMSERGYDTCPLEGFDEFRVKKILNLPKESKVSMIITCGIRGIGGVRGDRFRLPLNEYYKLI